MEAHIATMSNSWNRLIRSLQCWIHWNPSCCSVGAAVASRVLSACGHGCVHACTNTCTQHRTSSWLFPQSYRCLFSDCEKILPQHSLHVFLYPGFIIVLIPLICLAITRYSDWFSITFSCFLHHPLAYWSLSNAMHLNLNMYVFMRLLYVCLFWQYRDINQKWQCSDIG